MAYLYAPLSDSPAWLLIPMGKIREATYDRTYNKASEVVKTLTINYSWHGEHVKIARGFVKRIEHHENYIAVIFRDNEDYINLECTAYFWEHSI